MPTIVYGDFEWDEAKAEANEAKHGVRFEEAAQAFTDPNAVDFADTYTLIGSSRWRPPLKSVSST